MKGFASLLLSVTAASAAIVWDGRFNDYTYVMASSSARMPPGLDILVVLGTIRATELHASERETHYFVDPERC